MEHLKIDILKKLNSCEDRIQLKLSGKEDIKEIERLKQEVKINADKLLNAEGKIFKLITDLKYERRDILHNIITLELKLIRLGISAIKVHKIKDSILLF